MPYYNRDPKRDHNFDNHPYRHCTGVFRDDIGMYRDICVYTCGKVGVYRDVKGYT